MDNFSNQFESGFTIDTSFADNEPPKKEKLNPKKELIEWLGVVASALIIVVILFGFVFRVAIISGDSMKNTLINGDVVVISNFNYTPKQGDIVVVSRNAENTPESMREENGPIIKRVIATEFQTVNIDFETGIVLNAAKCGTINDPTSVEDVCQEYATRAYATATGVRVEVNADALTEVNVYAADGRLVYAAAPRRVAGRSLIDCPIEGQGVYLVNVVCDGVAKTHKVVL
jgi:signal peptidase I